MIFFRPFYWVLNVKDHLINKEKIIGSISSVNTPYHNYDVEDYTSYISSTDWVYKHQTNWFNYALSKRDIENYQKFVYRKFKKTRLHVNSSWFNQYYPDSGSEHYWHHHKPEPLTNIYFVELEDKSLRTILRHPVTGKEIIPRVKEGQMLTFDGRIEHMSPPNNTSTRKTVISFNTNFI
tara:strand:- start:145 stop:681 length:537 start_codon:yes stop_codon:yes gene_type:complete